MKLERKVAKHSGLLGFSSNSSTSSSSSSSSNRSRSSSSRSCSRRSSSSSSSLYQPQKYVIASLTSMAKRAMTRQPI